jgi:hypothetical protein
VADVWTEHGEATKVLVASFCTCIIAASGFVCTMWLSPGSVFSISHYLCQHNLGIYIYILYIYITHMMSIVVRST